MVQRTYYPPTVTYAEKPAPEAAFSTEPGVIRFGYTIRDIDRLTHGALIADRMMALDYADRKDVAWSAIAEHICAATEAPTRQELIRVGWQAIYQTVRDNYRQRGYRDGDYGTDGAPTMPRFAAYWSSNVTHFPDDRIVEDIAVGQVLATLKPIYRAAVTALAVADDYVKAADLLGLKYSAFTARISVARRQLLALWHEGETPRPVRTDRRVESHSATLATHCGNGHEWTPENTRAETKLVRGKPKHRRFCRECERIRGAARTAAKRARAGVV